MGSGSFLWCSHHSSTWVVAERGGKRRVQGNCQCCSESGSRRCWPRRGVARAGESEGGSAGRRRGGGRTFLSTLADTLGSGMAWSESPRSVAGGQGSAVHTSRGRGRAGRERALEHVLDEDRAVCDVAVDVKLLLVRSRELDLVGRHGGWLVEGEGREGERGEGEEEDERRRRRRRRRPSGGEPAPFASCSGLATARSCSAESPPRSPHSAPVRPAFARPLADALLLSSLPTPLSRLLHHHHALSGPHRTLKSSLGRSSRLPQGWRQDRLE